MPILLGIKPLQRLQLFLCDGNKKIYLSFDKHKERLIPNAENGLCNFHLVEKRMEQINPDIRGKDRIEVQNQKKTFKRWYFSWMRYGGVETMEEYKDLYSLLRI